MSKQPRTPVSEDQIRRDRAAYEFNLKWHRDNPKSRPRPKPATEATAPEGRTISESQAGDIVDQLIAQMQNPTPAELTAAELAKLEPGSVERSNTEVSYWASRMAGKSPFWS